eukprot:13243380-Alexandrium_andersonii.AAC.1
MQQHKHDTNGHATERACNCTATHDGQQARTMPPRTQATREVAAGPVQQSNPQSAAAALRKRPE